jgi:hypothetical protein
MSRSTFRRLAKRLDEGRESQMQLVRVATKDPQSANLLVVHLAGLFGGEQVSLQADGEVQVQLPELNGELVKTLKAVESWLEQSGNASAEVSVNEHSYTVEHPEGAKASMAFSRSTRPVRRVAVDHWDGLREAVGQQ